jgi:hypothetical protein
MEIVLRWSMPDEEEGNADEMDERANHDLRNVE